MYNKNRIILFLLFIGLNVSSTFAQSNQGKNTKKTIDSLLLALHQTKTDSSKINLYLKICELCEVGDNLKYATPVIKLIDKLLLNAKDSLTKRKLLKARFDAAETLNFYYRTVEGRKSPKIIDTYNEHIGVCKKNKDVIGIVDALLGKADVYNSLGEILKKLDCLKDGYALMQDLKFKKGESKFIMQLAFFYAEYGDTTQAMSYIKKAEKLEIEIADSTRISRGYYIRGRFYADMKKYDLAIFNYKISARRNKLANDTDQLLQIYYEIGNTYLNKKDYSNAIKFYKDCIELAEKNQYNLNFIGAAKVGIGDVYCLQKKYDEAIKEHLFMYQIYKSINYETVIAFVGKHLANDYYQKKDFKNAKKYIETVWTLANKTQHVPDLLEIEQLVYKTDSALGNFENAFIHFQNYLFYKNKINDDLIQKKLVQDKFQNDLNEQITTASKEQIKRDAKNTLEKEHQKRITYSVGASLFIVFIILIFILRGYKQKQKTNKELSIKNETIILQKHLVEEKQKEILDSITYAKRLQQAILPPEEFLNKYIPDNFILYKPKDIVAGDFYWAEKIDDLFFIGAADSTGHGVPGAMVSVVCSNALNRSVKEFNLTDAGKILDKTRELVIKTFEKSNTEVKDGMDISLLCINLKNNTVFWSGANNPLWYIQNNELIEIKAHKQPIGKTDNPTPFITHQILSEKDSVFYLFTDGFADQFGGPNGKKFKYRQLSDLLIKNNNLPMKKQSQLIDKVFHEWKGELEQVDDVCIIGVKI